MDIINDALEAAVNGKDRNEWTPVSVNVAPATLTILSKQVTAHDVDSGRVTSHYVDINKISLENIRRDVTVSSLPLAPE